MNRALENKTKFILILLSAAVWVLASCAGHQLEVKSISKSENPQQLINQLDNDIAMARKNQVNVLAPTWFERADNSLNAAREGLEEGGLLAELLENVATGRAQRQYISAAIHDRICEVAARKLGCDPASAPAELERIGALPGGGVR